MNEKALVVQHNKIIEARYKLTVEEQRLIKTLASRIQINDEDFKTYEIRIVDLAKILDISDTGYYDRVKKVTKKILGNVLSFTNENGDEVQTGWLSSAVYRKGKGTIELRFDPVLKPYLLQLKSFFTSYELGNILRLKGMYSIRIYELMKQYEKIGKREFSIDELKQTLKIDKEYPQYRDFKKFVLTPSQKEIAEKTDIEYDVTEKTRGRKVIGLVFEIRRSTKRSTAIPLESTPVPPEESDSQAVEQLVKLGVVRKMAQELAKEYGEAHISDKIAYAKTQQKEGKVKNLAGFVVEAIRNGYRDNQTEERDRQRAQADATALKEANRKEWDRMKSRWNLWRTEQIQAFIAAMDEETLTQQKAAFRESLKGSLMAKTIQSNPDSEERHFRIYIGGQMVGLTMPEWARAVGVDMMPFKEQARLDGKL